MKWPASLPTDAIDVLAYYGSWPHWPVPEADEAGLLRRMERYALRAAVVASLTTVFGDPLAGNDELAALAARHAGRLVGLATYDPQQAPPPAQVLGRARAAGLRGLALFPTHHGYELGKEPLVEEALWIAAEYGWPVLVPIRLIMAWTLPAMPPAQILDAARRHPRLNFIVAGANYSELDAVLRAMGELRNVYLETSCAQSLDALKDMVERGGAEHVLLGTGQPMQMVSCNLVKVPAAGLTPAEAAAVLRGNAMRLFGIQ
jgi:predicted TIM-barrel fold metal-dependent hydrolase